MQYNTRRVFIFVCVACVILYGIIYMSQGSFEKDSEKQPTDPQQPIRVFEYQINVLPSVLELVLENMTMDVQVTKDPKEADFFILPRAINCSLSIALKAFSYGGYSVEFEPFWLETYNVSSTHFKRFKGVDHIVVCKPGTLPPQPLDKSPLFILPVAELGQYQLVRHSSGVISSWQMSRTTLNRILTQEIRPIVSQFNNLPSIELYNIEEELMEYTGDVVNISNRNMSSCRLENCQPFLPTYQTCDLIDFGYSENNLLYFHSYWRAGYHQMLPLIIKSYIMTQSLNRTKFVIWSSEPLDHPDFLELKKAHPNNIYFKLLNLDELVTDTCMENNALFRGFISKARMQLQSDIFRVGLLNRYGGLWTDADVMFQRDMLPLIQVSGEFSSLLKGQQMNNHLLHVNKQTETGRKLTTALCRLIQPGILPVPSMVPTQWMLNDALTAYCNIYLNCSITPVSRCYTDPQWHQHFKGCDAFKNGKIPEYIHTSFAIHHRLDDCEDLPSDHFMLSIISNLEDNYYKKYPLSRVNPFYIPIRMV